MTPETDKELRATLATLEPAENAAWQEYKRLEKLPGTPEEERLRELIKAQGDALNAAKNRWHLLHKQKEAIESLLTPAEICKI